MHCIPGALFEGDNQYDSDEGEATWDPQICIHASQHMKEMVFVYLLIPIQGRIQDSGGGGGLITIITSGGGYGRGHAHSRDSQGVHVCALSQGKNGSNQVLIL